MRRYKNIITSIFIWVYGVSFGHQVIPHTHNGATHFSKKEQNKFASPCRIDKESHDHISHQYHFDEGWIDFLSCLLSNHGEHPVNDEEVASKDFSYAFSLKKLDYSVVPSTSFEFSLAIVNSKSFTIYRVSSIYENPYCPSHALRGPPFNIA